MNRYAITLIHTETREQCHSFSWGKTWFEAKNRARKVKDSDPAWKDWMLEISTTPIT